MKQNRNCAPNWIWRAGSVFVTPASDARKKWKRLPWDFHGATGFWSLAVLSMWAITGAYFAWPAEFRAAVNYFSPMSLAKVKKSDVSQQGKLPRPDVRSLLATAQRKSLGSSLLSISHPIDDRGNIRTLWQASGPASFDTADYQCFDQFTGKHLAVWQRVLNQSAGDMVISWIGPLHFGTFGGHASAGVAVKVVWVVLGLAPPTLALTGFLMIETAA